MPTVLSLAHQIHASMMQVFTVAANAEEKKNKKNKKKEEETEPVATENGENTQNTEPTPNDSPTPSLEETTNTTESGTADAFSTIISFLITNWWLILVVIGIIAANIGWKKLTFKYNLDGKPLPTLGSIISRTLRLIFIEDKTQVFLRPQKIAQKLTWLTWQKYWFIAAALLAIAFLGILEPIPDTVELVGTIIPALMTLHAFQHIRAIFRRRHRILMQMFEVANAEMRYPKGSELNPWGWVNITKWKDLYSPDVTVIAYPARFRGDDPRTQETFQANFNGTVSDAHTWTYEWETANNRVIATPVPFITTQAPYPFPDNKPWDIFPLGLAAGGNEAVVEVSKFPHMLIAGTTGSGKLLLLETPIPTLQGWTTMGEIKIGDQVFDENGNLCNVVGLSDINYTPDLYRVTFSDGSTIDADAEHLWWTETRKARESRWNSLSKKVNRKSLLPLQVIEQLRREANKCSDKDEVTLPELAAFINIHPSTNWLYDIANNIGHVSEIEVYADFNYAEQEVKQKQKVTVFDSAELWAKLSSYSVPNSSWEYKPDECKKLTASTVKGEVTTSTELKDFLGVKTTQNAVAIARRAGATGVIEIREVTLMVPEKTVRRKLPGTVRSYPKKELMLKVAEYGEKLKNDQRHLKLEGSVKTTTEILETLKTETGYVNHSVPVAGVLNLPEIELPVAPYTLGIWLGDGNSRNETFVGIDHEIAKILRELGHTLHERKPSDIENRHPDYRIWKVEGLKKSLKELGLIQKTTEEGSQKQIPMSYLRSSIEQRKALLAGLLDSDGTVSKTGSVEFANTNKKLAEQVRELALSLGYRATIRSGIKRSQHGTECLAYTVTWTCAESPFWLSRKSLAHQERNKNHNQQRNNTRFITDVTPILSKPGRCIMVDSPSRLFLAGDAMIPTHNSVTQRTILLHALQHPDWRVVLVDPKRVELSSYRNHPNVKKIATELDESVELIEMVEQEMQSRYIRMRDSGVNHFKRLEDPPPALLLMVDELFALLSPENIKSEEGKERDDLHARAQVLIGSIARLGRAAGIHLALATQRPDAKILGGEVKALALDTLVPTPSGWSTMGDLDVGDYVFGEHGHSVQVVDATDVMFDHQVFEVVFSDGEKIVADAGHRWEVFEQESESDFTIIDYATQASNKIVSLSSSLVRKVFSRVPLVGRIVGKDPEPAVGEGRKGRIVGTEELHMLLMQNFADKKYAVQVCGVSADDKNLFDSPKKGSTAFLEYLYGLLLGLCDQEVLDKETIISEYENTGHVEVFASDVPSWSRQYFKKNDASDNYIEFITHDDSEYETIKICLPSLLVEFLKESNGIHPTLLRSSYRERVSVLRGLMDSGSGFVYKNKHEYLNNRVACFGNGTDLFVSVQELVASLGWVYEDSEDPGTFDSPSSSLEGKNWRILWTPDVDVFASEETVRRQGRHDFCGYAEKLISGKEYRYIVEVNRLDESVPVRCIQVDSNSGLYLVGKKMVPTHNSNLDVRIAQGRMDTTPSLMVLDSDDATRIPGIKGRAMVRFGGAVTEFQAYFLPEEALDQVLEMSAAIANGLISAEELLAAVQNNEGDGKKKFAVPTRFLPKKLVAKFSLWIEKRKAVVEANESRSARYREEKEKQGISTGRKKKNSEDRVYPSNEDLNFDEVADAAEASGLSGEGFSLFDEDDDDEYEFYEEVFDGSENVNESHNAGGEDFEDFEISSEDFSVGEDLAELDDEFLKEYSMEIDSDFLGEAEEAGKTEETIDYYDENNLPDMDDLLSSLTFVDDSLEEDVEEETSPPPPKRRESDVAKKAKPQKVKKTEPESIEPVPDSMDNDFVGAEDNAEVPPPPPNATAALREDFFVDSEPLIGEGEARQDDAIDAPWMPAEPVNINIDETNSPFASIPKTPQETQNPAQESDAGNAVPQRPKIARPRVPQKPENEVPEDTLSGWDEEHTI